MDTWSSIVEHVFTKVHYVEKYKDIHKVLIDNYRDEELSTRYAIGSIIKGFDGAILVSDHNDVARHPGDAEL